MGLGKTYSADYLIDSNGNTGVSGQVLISTATGIDWADGSAITGGPYLPLAGGTITGNVRFNDTFKAEFGSSADLQINHDATDSLINNATGHLTIRNGANDKNIFLQADNGSGGNTSYLTLNGANTHAYFSNPGNVGIGTTDPQRPFHVNGGALNFVAEFQSTDDKASILIQDDDTLNYIHSQDGYLSLGGQNALNSGNLNIKSSDGNVGIGTTSPAQKLHVSGGHILLDNNKEIRQKDSGGTERTVFELDSSNDLNIGGSYAGALRFIGGGSYAEVMRIHDNGNVGIGTTSPGSLLQVGGLDDGSNYDITLGWNAVDSEAVGTKRSAITFKTGQTSVNTGDIYKWDIAMLAAPATVTNEEFGSDLAFLRSTRGSTATDATTMILTRTGNVGIGTASPNAGLEVANAENSALRLSRNSNSSNFLQLQGGSSGGVYNINTSGTQDHIFQTGGNERMRITSGGNVGIGTTAPDSKLSVTSTTLNSEDILYLKSGADNVNDYLGIAWELGVGGNGPHSAIRSFAGPSGSDARLGFLTTTDGGTTLTEGLSVAHNGNVGIGTTSPDAPLTVHSSTDPEIRFGYSSTQDHRIQWDSSKVFIHADPENANANSAIALAVDGGTKLYIPDSGNVGIGTTSPINFGTGSHLITVQAASGGGYGGLLAKTDNVTGQIWANEGGDNVYIGTRTEHPLILTTHNLEKVRIATSGNVGIGATNPTEKLVVNGNIETASNDGKIGFNVGDAHTNGPHYGLGKLSGATPVNLSGYYGLSFYTNGAERVRVSSDGNVGIGTTAPTSALTIKGTSPYIRLERAGVTTWEIRQNYPATEYGFQIVNVTAGTIPFFVGASNNVGIGTTSPTHKLHVNGDMRLTGALRDSNNAKGSAGQVLSSTGSATDWIPLPATPTIYTPKVYNLNNSTNINSQGQKLVPDFGTLEIEGNTTVQQVSGSDTDFQVTDENTGIYEVTYAVFYKNTGNQRTPLGTYLTLNGTAVNGSLMVNYVRSNVAGGGNFSSCTNTFYVNVTDASHPMALCVRRADSSTAPSGISMVEPTGMAVKSTISFRRIS